MSIRNGKVAYKSPIETIRSEIEYDYGERFDQMVLTAVQCVGIMVNKEELVKALAYDREQYRKGWEDRDAEIVRCDKCRWHYEQGRDIVCSIRKDVVMGDGYCSYWERKTDDE